MPATSSLSQHLYLVLVSFRPEQCQCSASDTDLTFAVISEHTDDVFRRADSDGAAI